MRALPVLALAALGATASFAAHAQRIAPGLWEMRMSMTSSDSKMQADLAAMQKELAQMSPAQRKMMEQMLAEKGAAFDANTGMPAARVCISKEQAERDELPTKLEGQCRYERMQRNGPTLRFAFVCTDPPGRGEGEITVQSEKAYTSRISTQTADKSGKSVRTDMQQQGRWVAADCGTLKPRPQR